MHERRCRRVACQGEDHQQVSRARLQGPRQLRPCPRSAAEGRLGPARADFAMSWEVGRPRRKAGRRIAKALRGADKLFLATDPDREGEAISWHVREMLRQAARAEGRRGPARHVQRDDPQRGARRDRHPREIDQPLVEAYLARRALDYLVGFTLSPVLWRKLPGSRSAGRVQSVALRLICEREAEIEAFRAREYWTVEAEFTTPARRPVHRAAVASRRQEARPVRPAERGAGRCARSGWSRPAGFTVARSRRSESGATASAPFTTSTLQQEASRKLGFGAQPTMRSRSGSTRASISTANGRPDHLYAHRRRADGARGDRRDPRACRAPPSAATICRRHRANVPEPAKNAQEAHEAIRPTDMARTRRKCRAFLSTRPAPALRADLEAGRGVPDAVGRARSGQRRRDRRQAAPPLRATGSVIAFDGFLKLYREDRDDAAEEEESRMLPPMAEREPLDRGDVTPNQHFTQPPPRYSEASLVKKMEELGIGRPSTYASILSVLQDRNYVRLEKRRFIPEDRGRLVTAFLTSFFERYVDTGFTASMEDQLDDISGGRVEWREVLRAILGGVLARRRSDQGSEDQRRDRRAGRGPRAALLSPATDGTRSRACPGLRQRPAGPEARPLRQLHRLLELPELPVHAARWRSRPARTRARH